MGDQLWNAPRATGPVAATVAVPGSKSMTNRALILAALSDGPSTITNPLLARDTDLMIGALRALGTEVSKPDTTDSDSNTIRVTPAAWDHRAQIDCGLAGTVMRFVPPAAAIATGAVFFDGDVQARQRPMSVVIDALRVLGVAIDTDTGSLPFTIRGTGTVTGGAVTIDASASSQFVSGLLLAGARYQQGIVVTHCGAPVPSLPHITMTIDMVRAAGGTVITDCGDTSEATWSVAPGPLNIGDICIEPDLSNAAVFLAAAMVTAGRVTIAGWPQPTTQPGDGIRAVFAQLGAMEHLDSDGLTVTGPDVLTGIDIDLHDIGELTPTIAAVCALATTPSRLRGIAHLAGHETDRLTALVSEINRLGGFASVTNDGIVIEPRVLRSAVVDSYSDHRMATFGAIIGLVVPGTRVINIATTGKTMPDFESTWNYLVATGGSPA